MPKLSPEVQRAIDDVKRPMRWDSAELIARDFVKDCLNLWIRLERDLTGILRDVSGDQYPTYETLMRRERSKGIDIPEDECTDHGCTYHHHHAQKRNVTGPEVRQLLQRLMGYLTAEQVQIIENLFRQYEPLFFSGGGAANYDGGIWNRYIPRVLQDGYDEAWERMDRAAGRQGGRETLEGRGAVAGAVVDPASNFTANVFQHGFRYVTSSITTNALGQAAGVLLEGLAAGDTWTEIADRMHQKIGTAYRYHWQRLVRTEMTYAYYESFVDRYQGGGVGFVKLSTSLGACPVCVDLKGYYVLGTQPPIPASTHPNCRCVYSPYFRLPEGVELRR